jgi:hypothetical protein
MLLLMLGNEPWNGWFRQVRDLIKEGLPGGKDYPRPLLLMLRGWAVDRWFRQVGHLIKKGLPGRKDCPWPLLLMLGDGLWTADSTKSATSSSRRAYLAE